MCQQKDKCYIAQQETMIVPHTYTLLTKLYVAFRAHTAVARLSVDAVRVLGTAIRHQTFVFVWENKQTCIILTSTRGYTIDSYTYKYTVFITVQNALHFTPRQTYSFWHHLDFFWRHSPILQNLVESITSSIDYISNVKKCIIPYNYHVDDITIYNVCIRWMISWWTVVWALGRHSVISCDE